MVKKIFMVVLCITFALLFGANAYAEDTMQDNTVNTEEQQIQTEPWQNMQGNKHGGNRPNGFGEQRPPSENFGNMPNDGQFNFDGMTVDRQPTINGQTSTMPFSAVNFLKEYQTPIMSVVLLLLAFVFVKLYKRKNY